MQETRTFNCATCHQRVTEHFNKEIAEAEFRRDFPMAKFDPKNIVLVCEPCYKEIIETVGDKEGGGYILQ